MSRLNVLCPPSGSNGADVRAKNDAQRIILVMFLGGCTFSEISALRFLGREKGRHGLNYCGLFFSFLFFSLGGGFLKIFSVIVGIMCKSITELQPSDKKLCGSIC